MGIYAATVKPLGNAFSPEEAYNEFDKVEDALDDARNYYTIELRYLADSDGTALTTIADEAVCPYAGTLVKVIGSAALAFTGTAASSDFDVYNQTSGATVLSGVVAGTTLLTAMAGTIAAPTIAADDILSLRTHGASGHGSNRLTVTCIIKKTLTA